MSVMFLAPIVNGNFTSLQTANWIRREDPQRERLHGGSGFLLPAVSD
jgi:hypothetical protein